MRLLNPQGTPRPAVCLQYLERLKTDGHKKIKKIMCDPAGVGWPASLTEDSGAPIKRPTLITDFSPVVPNLEDTTGLTANPCNGNLQLENTSD